MLRYAPFMLCPLCITLSLCYSGKGLPRPVEQGINTAWVSGSISIAAVPARNVWTHGIIITL